MKTLNKIAAAQVFNSQIGDEFNYNTEYIYEYISTISSFGSTGVLFNGRLEEEYSKDSKDIIINLLDSNDIKYKLEKTHLGEEDMPQDEWIITIY